MKPIDEISKDFNENWAKHNPFRNLDLQLSTIERLKEEAYEELLKYSTGDVVPDWVILYYNISMTSTISSLEFFFRELVLNEYILSPEKKSIYYNEDTGRFRGDKGNFQNYGHLVKFLKKEFSIDIESEFSLLEKEWLKFILGLRHIVTHNGGIADKGFIKLVGSFSELKISGYSIGSWVGVDHVHMIAAKNIVLKIKKRVEAEVKKLDKSEIEILFESLKSSDSS